ncbi:MAG: alpha/beta hydrolase [Treponema sp.]|nr:alpha/beta hydrolase [Treponema sp.]
MTHKIKLLLNILSLILITKTAFAVPGTINLWRNVKGMENEHAWMKFYKANPELDKKACVIVCPGGSYHHLGIFHEGIDVAKWFAKNGVNAFMLRYRVAGDGYSHPAMLEDIQRAIQLIRENADEWNIDPSKIGAIGFSAGGHLVAMAGAFGDKENELEKLGIKTTVSLKPDFVMPIYPVVSMQDDIGHQWSRKSLIGRNPDQALKDKFSLELQIPKDMCPVFLLTNKDDRTVMYENSQRLAKALKDANVSHVYYLGEHGDHGFGMGNNKVVQESQWHERLLKPWLISLGVMAE